MAEEEETTSSTEGSGESETSESEETSSSTQESEETGGSSHSEGESAEALRAKLAAANREAAKFRRERNAARADLDKLKDKDLSDVEREKKRADDAEARLTAQQERVQQANLSVALSQHGSIVDVETAAMLLRSRGIEFDDDGKPVDVATAIESLVKDKPFLTGKGQTTHQSGGSTNAGAGNESGEQVTLTADELEMARAFKMSPEDYQKFKSKDAAYAK